MSISIGVSVEFIFKKGGVEGIELPDGSVLPFGTPVREIWVIHPEETAAGTCEECAALAGTIFEAGEGQMPPVHVNCVCERVPVMETFDPATATMSIPTETLSVPIKKLDNMADDALWELIEQSQVDPKTIARARLLLKRRKGAK